MEYSFMGYLAAIWVLWGQTRDASACSFYQPTIQCGGHCPSFAAYFILPSLVQGGDAQVRGGCYISKFILNLWTPVPPPPGATPYSSGLPPQSHGEAMGQCSLTAMLVQWDLRGTTVSWTPCCPSLLLGLKQWVLWHRVAGKGCVGLLEGPMLQG